MDRTPAEGTFLRTGGQAWLAGPDGLLLREDAGRWSVALAAGAPGSRIADVTEDDSGDVYFAQSFAEADTGCVFRFSGDAAPVAFESGWSTPAVLWSQQGSLWTAGRELATRTGSGWSLAGAISDTTRVAAIGDDPDLAFQLVCRDGVIYDWDPGAGAAVTVQPFPLRAAFTSLSRLGGDLIYGTLNVVEENTGHDIGLIVRYDGVQWVTTFLVPPRTP
jgi:hypothetical protein